MEVLFSRSMTRDWRGGGAYELRILLALDAAELAVIAGHAIGDVEVWLSPAALALEGAAERCAAASSAGGGWSFETMWAGVTAHRQALAMFKAARDEPRLTVADLIAGATLAADEVAELVAVEAGVRAALAPLQARIEALVAYEDADENVAAVEVESGGVPVTQWFASRRR